MTVKLMVLLSVLMCFFTSSALLANGPLERGMLPEKSEVPAVEQAKFPEALMSYISVAANIKKSEVHPLQGGTLRWSGGFIAAVSSESKIDNCSIYVSNGGVMSNLFSHYPCIFKGKPLLSFQRGNRAPDVIYEISMYAPQNGAMVDELVAFSYDVAQNAYCRSKNLESWYISGNKSLPPDLSDAECFGVD